MASIALCGFYAKKNFGDDLMANALSTIISLNKHIVNIYSDDSNYQVKDGLKNKQYLNNDVIVFGGGGIVSSDFWAFQNNGLEDLIKLKKKVAFINVGLYKSEFNNIWFINQIKALNAEWWVRDTQSVQLLKSIGVSSHLVSDIIFQKDFVPIKNNELKNDKKIVSVFLNNYVVDFILSKQDVLENYKNQVLIKEVAIFLDWLASFNCNIVLVPAQTARKLDDRISNYLVYSNINSKLHTKCISRGINYQSILKLISMSHLVVSMRYHSTAAAIASGVPVINLNHHDKNKNLIHDVGLGDMSIECSDLTQEKLIYALDQAKNDLYYNPRRETYCIKSQEYWKLFEKEWEIFLGE